MLIMLVCMSLTGCQQAKSMFAAKDGCLSVDGQQVAIQVIKDGLETRVAAAGPEQGVAKAAISKIRAALDQVKFVIEDVRTTKQHPNSTKKFCTGKLKATFPDEYIKDASYVLSGAGGQNLDDRAAQEDIERNANTFSMDIDFNVQPTDEGDKVYSEVEQSDKITGFLGHIIASNLYRKRIEQDRTAQLQAEEEVKRADAAAQSEQKQASYGEAKAADDLSSQSIGAAWNALSPEVRARTLSLQRAWIKRKDADCKVEASGVSTDPTERETARLICNTRLNNERTEVFKAALQQSSYTAEEEVQ